MFQFFNFLKDFVSDIQQHRRHSIQIEKNIGKQIEFKKF